MSFLPVVALCLAQALPVLSPTCLPADEVNRVIHYQAWSNDWNSLQIFANEGTLDLSVLKDGTDWLAYDTASKVLFRLTESKVSMSTCWHEKDWKTCVAEARSVGPTQSFSDLLLGKVRPADPLDFQSACSMRVSLGTTDLIWKPSAQSERKQKILALVKIALRRGLNNSGTISKIICANFHVNDPQVWLVVDTVGQRPGRLLVGVELDSNATVAVIRNVTPADSQLVSRIQRDPMAISVVSAMRP